MKKALLILCLLLALACLFAACDNDGDQTPTPDGTQNSEQSGETPEPEAHTHSWSAWKEVTPTTCTTKGTQKRTCACGASETQEAALKQHIATHREAVEATCGTTGNAEYWECTVCNKYFSNVACTTEIANKTAVSLPAMGGCVYNTQNVCTICNTAMQYTEGLAYTLNSDEESYSVSEGTALNNTTDIVIPWYYNEKPVTSISEYAFWGCGSLTSVNIPASVTSVGKYAFYECSSLTSIAFAESSQLTNIGFNAFSGCSSLTSINIPASMTSIGVNAFYDCSSLTSVTFAEGSQLTSIGNFAFYGCSSLTSFFIPASVTSIDIFAFDGCSNLRSVTFENAQGWWYAFSSTATSGTSISATMLADTSTAATYLKSTYGDYYWKRTVS